MRQIGNEPVYEGEEVKIMRDEELEKSLERARTIIKVIGAGGAGPTRYSG